jgi:hypothetical protein
MENMQNNSGKLDRWLYRLKEALQTNQDLEREHATELEQ